MSTEIITKKDPPKWAESASSHSALDQLHWLGDEVVPDAGITVPSSLSAVVFKESLYVFYVNYNGITKLYYNVYDGTKWWGATKIPNHGWLAFGPSAVTFDDNIYVFYTNSKDDSLRYIVFDGLEWSGNKWWWGEQPVPGTHNLWSTPAAVYVPYDDTIYIFYNDNYQIWYTIYDGYSWYGERQIMNAGIARLRPAGAAAYGNKVFCFHPNQDEDGTLCYSAYNGKYWEGDIWVAHMVSKRSPACAVYQGKLYVFHPADDYVLKYNVLAGGEE